METYAPSTIAAAAAELQHHKHTQANITTHARTHKQPPTAGQGYTHEECNVCVCVYVIVCAHTTPTHTYTRADTCSPHKSQVVTRFISTNMIHARPVLRAFGLAGEDHLVTPISTFATLRAVFKA